MKPTNRSRIPLSVLIMFAALPVFRMGAAEAQPSAVDFRYSPPEWQTAICLPDDPHKSLVDRSGELLYHYGQGGREFATRVGVEVGGGTVWQKQQLQSGRVPIVRTLRATEGLEVVEEAFAVTDLRQTNAPASPLQRVDSGAMNRDWAQPPAAVDPSLKHIAVHMDGTIRYELKVPAGASRQVALALCEGWWHETAKRVQVLRVEGAEPKTVDTVADIGQNKAAAFWFAAKDTNGDGKIEIAVEAAPQAADNFRHKVLGIRSRTAISHHKELTTLCECLHKQRHHFCYPRRHFLLNPGNYVPMSC